MDSLSARMSRTVAIAAVAGFVALSSTPLGAVRQTGTPLTPQQRLERVSAQIFASPDQQKAAIPELKKILAIDPTLAEAHMLLAVAYRGTGSGAMVGEAKAELQQALDLDPGLIAARLLLAQVYLDLGRYENARDEAMTALVQVPGQPQFLSVLGEAERHLGHPDRALELNRQAFRADPSLVQARYFACLALLDLGQREEAIRDLEDLARGGAQVLDLYIRLGIAYGEVGRLDNAVSALEAAVQLDGTSRDARIQLARAYRVTGQLVRAEQQLTVASQPAQKDVTQAYQALEASLQVEWGLLRLRQGRLVAAAAALVRALDLDPKYGPAHRALAEVSFRQGAYARAAEHATQAEALGAPLPADLRQALDAKLRTLPPKGSP